MPSYWISFRWWLTELKHFYPNVMTFVSLFFSCSNLTVLFFLSAFCLWVDFVNFFLISNIRYFSAILERFQSLTPPGSPLASDVEDDNASVLSGSVSTVLRWSFMLCHDSFGCLIKIQYKFTQRFLLSSAGPFLCYYCTFHFILHVIASTTYLCN